VARASGVRAAGGARRTRGPSVRAWGHPGLAGHLSGAICRGAICRSVDATQAQRRGGPVAWRTPRPRRARRAGAAGASAPGRRRSLRAWRAGRRGLSAQAPPSRAADGTPYAPAVREGWAAPQARRPARPPRRRRSRPGCAAGPAGWPARPRDPGRGQARRARARRVHASRAARPRAPRLRVGRPVPPAPLEVPAASPAHAATAVPAQSPPARRRSNGRTAGNIPVCAPPPPPAPPHPQTPRPADRRTGSTPGALHNGDRRRSFGTNVEHQPNRVKERGA